MAARVRADTPTFTRTGPARSPSAATTNLVVEGFGGDGTNGGSGYGGFAGIYAFDGTIDLGPTIGLFASGWGGAASFGFGGFGGYGSGGTAYIEALANPGETFGTITADAERLCAGRRKRPRRHRRRRQ